MGPQRLPPMTPSLAATLVALVLSSAARGGPEPAPPVAPEEPTPSLPSTTTETGLTWQADLRTEYLAGQPILIALVARNAGPADEVVPDLSQRPWLVRFRLVQSNGKKQVWRTTAPEVDAGRTWTIKPGSWRDVLLEIPSSGTLPSGTYTLVVSIGPDDATVDLPEQTIKLALPRPIAGAGAFHGPTSARVGDQSVWVHDTGATPQLYLHHAAASDPSRSLGDYFLGEVEPGTQPHLALSLPASAWARHVYWLNGRTLGFVQLTGPGRPVQPGRIDLPWKSAVFAGDGFTDASGGLHVPIWVPQPGGTRGELQVVSFYGRGAPEYRQVARLAKPADTVVTTVDGSGALRLLVAHDGMLDQYVANTAPGSSLPARGRRLGQVTGGSLVAARYGVVETRGDVRGGLSLFLLESVPGTEEDPAERLRGRWLTLDGTEIAATPAVPRPPGSVIEVLPRGAGAWDVVLEQEGGRRVLLSNDSDKLVPLDAGLAPTLVGNNAGGVWLRTFVNNKLASFQPLHAP